MFLSLCFPSSPQIVAPYYNGNLSGAVQDLIQKALGEQDFVLSHIAGIRLSEKQQLR